MTREQLIETMARSMAYEEWPYASEAERQKWMRMNWMRFVRKATAALTAIEAAGMRVVPVEPTERMIDAGDKISRWTPAEVIYRAMLAAQEDSTSE